MKLPICPMCNDVTISDSCNVCNIEWSCNELDPLEIKTYQILSHKTGIKNVRFGTNYFETKCNLKDALGDTISERMESLYLKILQVSNLLNGHEATKEYKFDSIFCSLRLWEDILQHSHPLAISKEETKILSSKGVKLGTMRHKPIYMLPDYDENPYWLIVQSKHGLARIIVEVI